MASAAVEAVAVVPPAAGKQSLKHFKHDTTMTPETFTNKLQANMGDNLHAVVLYGSAAASDYVEKQSDYNILLVAEQWSLKTLDSLRTITAAWTKIGNPAPLCFTPERLIDSADVFPMEMLDILESHKILHGTDPLKGLQVSQTHLRHQLEFELRSKLLKLRHAYLQMDAPTKQIPAVLNDSLSSFLALFRGALRLFSATVPTDKLTATRELAAKLKVDLSIFEAIKAGKIKDSSQAFSRYLTTIEAVLDQINATQPNNQ